MNLKKLLKLLKFNESTISMILGSLVIVVVGILTVNYLKERVPGQKGLLPFLTGGNKTEITENLKPNTYKVAKGDNLWKIAEGYYGSGYNWVDIAKENKLSDASEIEVGQELTMPLVSAKTETKAESPTAEVKEEVKATQTVSQNTTETIAGATYTVVKGDSLWKIAVRAYGDGYKWVEVARENKLSHPNLIHPGNILNLPR